MFSSMLRNLSTEEDSCCKRSLLYFCLYLFCGRGGAKFPDIFNFVNFKCMEKLKYVLVRWLSLYHEFKSIPEINWGFFGCFGSFLCGFVLFCFIWVFVLILGVCLGFFVGFLFVFGLVQLFWGIF